MNIIPLIGQLSLTTEFSFPFLSEAAEVRKTKREKFSIFNFLSSPPQPESTTPEPGQEAVARAAIEPPSNNRTETTNTASVKTESVQADPAVSAGESKVSDQIK